MGIDMGNSKQRMGEDPKNQGTGNPGPLLKLVAPNVVSKKHSGDGEGRRYVYDLADASLEVHGLLIIVHPVEDPDGVRLAANYIESEDAIQRITICAIFANHHTIEIDIVAPHGRLDGHRGIPGRDYGLGRLGRLGHLWRVGRC